MGKHDKTLAAIFALPTRANLHWAAIEGLLKSLGAEFSEGAGSRIRIVLNGVRTVFHRPHPRPEAGRGTVESVRKFLKEAGVQP